MSLNGYSYVEGNTPNRTDPTGMCSKTQPALLRPLCRQLARSLSSRYNIPLDNLINQNYEDLIAFEAAARLNDAAAPWAMVNRTFTDAWNQGLENPNGYTALGNLRALASRDFVEGVLLPIVAEPFDWGATIKSWTCGDFSVVDVLALVPLIPNLRRFEDVLDPSRYSDEFDDLSRRPRGYSRGGGSSGDSRYRDLGTDSQNLGRFRPHEADTAIRLEQQLGITLRRHDPNVAVRINNRNVSKQGDWIDQNNLTYDGVSPIPDFFDFTDVQRSIDVHHGKSGIDFIVIDTTPLSPSQAQQVHQYANSLQWPNPLGVNYPNLIKIPPNW